MLQLKNLVTKDSKTCRCLRIYDFEEGLGKAKFCGVAIFLRSAWTFWYFLWCVVRTGNEESLSFDSVHCKCLRFCISSCFTRKDCQFCNVLHFFAMSRSCWLWHVEQDLKQSRHAWGFGVPGNLWGANALIALNVVSTISTWFCSPQDRKLVAELWAVHCHLAIWML